VRAIRSPIFVWDRFLAFRVIADEVLILGTIRKLGEPLQDALVRIKLDPQGGVASVQPLAFAGELLPGSLLRIGEPKWVFGAHHPTQEP